MEEKLNDKEFLEILIKSLSEDEKEHLRTEYNNLSNKHQKIDYLYNLSELTNYEYSKCMEILKRNFFS